MSGLNVEIRYVENKDKEFVMSIDKHVNDKSFENRVYTKSGYVIWEDGCPIGVMVHCILWDNLPFLNFIYVKEEYRGKGYASQAMKQWEDDMRKQGYKMVLISTQVDESAQSFYRKIGYIDCGGLLFNETPFEQPMEMFMRKVF